MTKAYFTTLGKISAHRVIVKCLPFERIIDYLIIGSTKVRVQEIITLTAYQDRYQANECTISQA